MLIWTPSTELQNYLYRDVDADVTLDVFLDFSEEEWVKVESFSGRL